MIFIHFSIININGGKTTLFIGFILFYLLKMLVITNLSVQLTDKVVPKLKLLVVPV